MITNDSCYLMSVLHDCRFIQVKITYFNVIKLYQVQWKQSIHQSKQRRESWIFALEQLAIPVGYTRTVDYTSLLMKAYFNSES